MNRTVLQIPLSQDLKISAEKAALSQGFSSLQEIVRIFLRKLADRAIGITFEEEVALSAGAVKRYNKVLRDIEEGKNVYAAGSVQDLMKQLHSA